MLLMVMGYVRWQVQSSYPEGAYVIANKWHVAIVRGIGTVFDSCSSSQTQPQPMMGIATPCMSPIDRSVIAVDNSAEHFDLFTLLRAYLVSDCI